MPGLTRIMAQNVRKVRFAFTFPKQIACKSVLLSESAFWHSQEGDMSLKDRLELEREILEKIEQSRDGSAEQDYEALERAIIERELAELEEQVEPEPEHVLVRRRKHN